MSKRSDLMVKHWIGEEASFTFGQRVFHLVSLAGFLLLSALGLSFLVSRLIPSTLICLSLSGLIAFCYYLSRFRDRTTLGAALSSTAVYLVIVVNFFTMNGSQGPALYSLFVIFLILAIVSPSRYIPYLIGFNLFTVALLLSIEYWLPQWVFMNPEFSNEALRLTSTGFIYAVVSITLLAGAAFVKRQIESYHRRIKQQVVDLKRKEIALANANHQKDLLFKLIGHDLRSPLSSIESFLDLMNGDLDKESQAELSKELLELSQHSRQLLENILHWARESEELKLKNQELDELIKEALGTLGPQARQKEITIGVETRENEQILCDKNLILAALRNLIANAIKFTNSGGRITIAYQKGEDHQISVQDNGVGIAAEDLNILFEGGTTLRRGTKNEAGLGLGLQLSYQFIRKHGGRISVESKLNQGSKFTIHLPIQKQRKEAGASLPSEVGPKAPVMV